MKTKFSHKVLSCVVAVAMMAGLAIPAFATDANAPAPTGTTDPAKTDVTVASEPAVKDTVKPPDKGTAVAKADTVTYTTKQGKNPIGEFLVGGIVFDAAGKELGRDLDIHVSKTTSDDEIALEVSPYGAEVKRTDTSITITIIDQVKFYEWVNANNGVPAKIQWFFVAKDDATSPNVSGTIGVWGDNGCAQVEMPISAVTIPVGSTIISGITAPVIDAAPITTAPDEKLGYTTSEIKWEPEEELLDDDKNGKIFKGNTAYTATFTLTEVAPYSFDGMSEAYFSSNSTGAEVIDFIAETGAMKILFPATAELNFYFLNYRITELEARIARAVKAPAPGPNPADVLNTQECISTEDANKFTDSIALTKAFIKNHVELELKQSDIDTMVDIYSTSSIDAYGYFQTGTKGGALTLEDQNIAINAALNAKAGVVSVKLGTKEAEIDSGVKFVSFGDMNLFDGTIKVVQDNIDGKNVNEKNIINLYNAIDTFKASIKTGTKPSSYNPSTVPTTNTSGSTGSTTTTTTTTAAGNAPVTSSSFEGIKADMSSDATNEDGKAITDPKVKIEDVDLTDPAPETKAFVLAAEGFAISDILEINLFDGTTPVTRLANGKLRVTVPFERSPLVPADAKYYILHDNGDGTVTSIPATISEDGKSISFDTDQYSMFAVAVISDDMNLFNDINVDPIVVPEVKPTTPTTPTNPTIPTKPVIKPSLNPATGVSLLGQLF